MSWGHIDDKLHSHPKVDKAGVEAMGLWVLGLSWSHDHGTAGMITFDRAVALCKSLRKAKAYVGKLVESGFWEPHPTQQNTYIMHDFDDWNPAAAKRAALSEARREAGRKGAAARWQTTGIANGKTIATDANGAGNDEASGRQALVRAGARAGVSGSPDQVGSSGDPDLGCPETTSKTSTSGEDAAAGGERPSEVRVASVRLAENQDDDGCFGEAVRGWARGISSVTGHPFAAPRYGVELDRLVHALCTHHPDVDGREEWARDAGAEFARSEPPQLGVYQFVAWLNGGRRPLGRARTAKVQPAPTTGSEWESGEGGRFGA